MEEIKIDSKIIDNAIEQALKEVGDEGLFPNHTDEDIFRKGFEAGVAWFIR